MTILDDLNTRLIRRYLPEVKLVRYAYERLKADRENRHIKDAYRLSDAAALIATGSAITARDKQERKLIAMGAALAALFSIGARLIDKTPTNERLQKLELDLTPDDIKVVDAALLREDVKSVLNSNYYRDLFEDTDPNLDEQRFQL